MKKQPCTTIIPTIEGSLEDDFPPVVKMGRMTLAEASKFAAAYGGVGPDAGVPGYAEMAIVETPSGFLANFANEEGAEHEESDDGGPSLIHPDEEGHLRLTFVFGEIEGPFHIDGVC